MSNKFVGFFNVTAGTYLCETSSDDGSYCYIDNVQIVDNGGYHGSITISNSVALTAG